MATTFIRVPQTGGAPEDYLVSGAADIDLLSASAHFDGSGAGSAFFPAIQVLDEAGQVAATVVGPRVAAGGSADVTFAPFLEQPTDAAPTSAALPWAEAYDAGYNNTDFFAGTSPDPLFYSTFAGNDATAFAFNQTNFPTVGDGEVHILRSGFYRLRLLVNPKALLGAFGSPGYLWDMLVQMRAVDNIGTFFFGQVPLGAGPYFSEGSYAVFWDYTQAAPQPLAPNFPTPIYPNPRPAADGYFNFTDGAVSFPVIVYARFQHGLNDADVHARGRYYLQLTRLGEANPSASTG